MLQTSGRSCRRRLPPCSKCEWTAELCAAGKTMFATRRGSRRSSPLRKFETPESLRIVNNPRDCSYSPHDHQKHRNASARDLPDHRGDRHTHRIGDRLHHGCDCACGWDFHFDWPLASSTDQLNHLPGKLRAGTAFFVFEINESVTPGCVPAANEIGPLFYIF